MRPRVALISMPWAPVVEPSLGLAILKAQLNREGIDARVFHANLFLLRYLTAETFDFLANWWGINEFLFTGVLDHETSSEQLTALAVSCRKCVLANQTEARRSGSSLVADECSDATALGRVLLRIRHEIVPRFLADSASAVLAYEPTMVGFTCLFDQTIAAVSLATVIKDKRPDILSVFGGYALEGPPGREILKAFPAVDCIALGDGEPVIGRLAATSVGQDDLSNIPGVVGRRPGRNSQAVKIALDSSPDPDFSDWYSDLAKLREADKVEIKSLVLPVEASRGCWWGEKKHCVFCGIDDVSLSYRAKSPNTVLRMLSALQDKHVNDCNAGGEVTFRFSDYIFPHSYQKQLLPQLSQVSPHYNLVCEIKSNQTRESMRAFAAAGFKELQPGIESFSSSVLKDFDKGVTAIQNVFTLKLGYIYRIVINYNILHGLPSDKIDDYKDMLARVPLLYHLTPPVGRSELFVTRFAPLHTDPARFQPDAKLQHHDCYDMMFSKEFLERRGFSLDEFCYYFKRYFSYQTGIEPIYQYLIDELGIWQRQHRERDVFLSYEAMDDEIRFEDSRFGCERSFTLGYPERAAYLVADPEPITVSRAIEKVTRDTGLDVARVRSALDELIERRLLWVEGERVLGLAIERQVVDSHRATDWKRQWASVFL